jgi:hypothetical protein
MTSHPSPTALIALADKIDATRADDQAIERRKWELSEMRGPIEAALATARARQAERAVLADAASASDDLALISSGEEKLRGIEAELAALVSDQAERRATLLELEGEFRLAWAPYRLEVIETVPGRLLDGLRRDFLGAWRYAAAVGTALGEDFGIEEVVMPGRGNERLIAGAIVRVGNTREDLRSSWHDHRDLAELHATLTRLSGVDRSIGARRRYSAAAMERETAASSGIASFEKPGAEHGFAVMRIRRPQPAAAPAPAATAAPQEIRELNPHGALVMRRARDLNLEGGTAFVGRLERV